MRSGLPVATIKDVAKRAGVSISTVSNVMAGRTSVGEALRERVRAAIRDLDYHPNQIARSLKVKQTNMIGMVIPDITNPYFPELMRGAEDAARERGYLLVTANTDERLDLEREVISAFRSRCVDGLLLASTAAAGEVSHIRIVSDSGVPVVLVDRVPEGLLLDAVSVDNVKGAESCVRHLIRTGHRDIAIITGSLTTDVGRERLEGYRSALEEAGMEIRSELVFEGDFRERCGYRLGKEILLRRSPPSALFVSNGAMALGVLLALDETGFACPRDIALATFDDFPVGHAYHPHLTAVAQPVYELGSRSATLVIDRIEGRRTGGPVHLRLPAELRIRESTTGRLQEPVTPDRENPRRAGAMADRI